MIDPKQLKTLIVYPITNLLTPWNVDQATELLMGTCMQESRCGQEIHQLGFGPALGIMQMEPATEQLVWDWAQTSSIKLPIAGLVMPGIGRTSQLVGNLYYAVGMARALYLSISERLPVVGDVIGQAAYWKKYYNTEKGKGTVEEFIQNWHDLQRLL